MAARQEMVTALVSVPDVRRRLAFAGVDQNWNSVADKMVSLSKGIGLHVTPANFPKE